MYQIQLIPDGEVYDVADIVLRSPFVPRVGEIITVKDKGKELKLFVRQIAYSYSSGGIERGISLQKVKALVSDTPQE